MFFKKIKPLHHDLLREIQFAWNTMQKKIKVIQSKKLVISVYAQTRKIRPLNTKVNVG